MRVACIDRKTAETDISLTLNLDGSGKSDIDSGCGFLDHMLTLFASHGRFDLTVRCKGDTNVDYHHTVEDIAIVLGSAFAEALGDKRGIHRYGDTILPMDEALILSAVDYPDAHSSYICSTFRPSAWAISTQSFVRNSGSASSVARSALCIFARSRDTIRITL